MSESTVATAVQQWLDETIKGSPIAGDADSLNHLRRAAPTLVAALDEPGKRSAEEIARRWFWDHLPGSAVARDEARWQHALKSLETLVTRLQPQKE